MSKYIYTTPENVTFVKRSDKGNIQLEVRVNNFHIEQGIDIDQGHQSGDPFTMSHDRRIEGLNLEEIRWLLEALEDACSILEMKKEEENE